MKYILLALATVMLVACSTPNEPETKPITVVTEPIPRPPLNLPPVDRFNPQDVNWIIITPENADEIFRELEERGGEPVLIGVTDDGYEAIAINNQQALRVIQQQQAVIEGYRRYYVAADGVIRRHNDNLDQ